jgi:hypothetical protein
VIALGALMATWALASSSRSLVQAIALITISLSAIAYLASGALMTEAMSAVGVSIWKLTLSIVVQIGLGIAALVLIPQIKLRSR